MQARPYPEQNRIATHFNADAPPYRVCDAHDTACGVLAWMLDRWVSSRWADVSCKRCLRKKPVPPSGATP